MKTVYKVEIIEIYWFFPRGRIFSFISLYRVLFPNLGKLQANFAESFFFNSAAESSNEIVCKGKIHEITL